MKAVYTRFCGTLLTTYAFALFGCAPRSAPPTVFDNGTFMYGIDECTRVLKEPLSADQLKELAGPPDRIVRWNQTPQLLLNERKCDPATIQRVMNILKDKYEFIQGDATASPVTVSLEGVEVWLYMWNRPADLAFSDIMHTPAGKYSIAILVERNRVITLGSILLDH